MPTVDDPQRSLFGEGHLEYRQALQDPTFAGPQILIAPVQRCAHGLMPWLRGATTMPEKVQAVVQLRLQPYQRQRIDLRGRQFNSQWQTVQTTTETAHGSQILLAQAEIVLPGTRAADQQLHRRIAHELIDTGRCRGLGKGQWRNRLQGFQIGLQRFATGDQQRQPRRRQLQSLHQCPA